MYVHESWDEPPVYTALPDKEYYQPCDYYGGNLGGILDALGYLRDMGIAVLYLNPVVEAASNHRYNTGDYKNIDPVLGTAEQFAGAGKSGAPAWDPSDSLTAFFRIRGMIAFISTNMAVTTRWAHTKVRNRLFIIGISSTSIRKNIKAGGALRLCRKCRKRSRTGSIT